MGRMSWAAVSLNHVIHGLAAAVLAGFAGPAGAVGTEPSALCDQAARIAAMESGVPVSVLKAISLTETGRKSGGAFRPWPWTVNMEGAGLWFDTPQEVMTYVEKEFARGARSFDMGCFQINYKWHHQNFASLEAMLDPLTNARYAARFLGRLYTETGDWSSAAGAYHSRTPDYASRYAARFDRFRAGLLDEDGMSRDPAAIIPVAQGLASGPRVNSFPLLLAGRGDGQMGSLVPVAGLGSTAGFLSPAGG